MLKFLLFPRGLSLPMAVILGFSLGGQPAALAQATPPTVVFQEVATSLAPLFTQPVQPRQGEWTVDKFIRNATQAQWTDFHITLQVWNGSSWVDSGEGDGISFGQPTPFATWLAGVKVDIDGVFVGGWHVERTNVPVDRLDFIFDTFTVMPGQQLSLHFDMVDLIGDNTWRLEQVPTIPEPATVALWIGGLIGMGLVSHRRRQR